MTSQARPGRAPGRSGSGPMAATEAAFSTGVLDAADGGAAEVADMGLAGEAETDDVARNGAAVLVHLGVAAVAATDAGQAGSVEAPHAVHAEMDAEPEVALEAEEHLLAVGFGGLETLAVERRGAVGEAALRGAGGQDVADEMRGEGVGETVDGVTFGQGAILFGIAQIWAKYPVSGRTGPGRWRGARRRQVRGRGRR